VRSAGLVPPSTIEELPMMMKKAKGGKMGNPAALPTEKFSARAKRATLRGDDVGTYKKGGMTKMRKGGKC